MNISSSGVNPLRQLKKQAIFAHEVHNFHAKLTMSSVGTGPGSMLLPQNTA